MGRVHLARFGTTQSQLQAPTDCWIGPLPASWPCTLQRLCFCLSPHWRWSWPFYGSSPDRRVYHPARRRAGAADRRARACGCCSLAIMACALTIARNP